MYYITRPLCESPVQLSTHVYITLLGMYLNCTARFHNAHLRSKNVCETIYGVLVVIYVAPLYIIGNACEFSNFDQMLAHVQLFAINILAIVMLATNC